MGYQAQCIAFEVGSRGLLIESELEELKDALKVPAKQITDLAISLSLHLLKYGVHEISLFNVYTCIHV